MLKSGIIKNHLITRRVFLFGSIQYLALSTLIGRVLYMQTIQKKEYEKLADQNRINVVMLHPTRGEIVDIHGRIIASNKSIYKVILDKRSNRHYKLALDNLCKILNLDEQQRLAIDNKIRKHGLHTPLEILSDITWSQLSLIEENILCLNGIYVEIGLCRIYFYEYAMSHLIGYIGILNKEDKRKLDMQYVGNFNVGKSGIEKYYEQQLRGDFGVRRMEVNAYGLHLRELSVQHSIPGHNLRINIDAELQSHIYDMLPDSGGSAIVMDVNNGGLLACVSRGGFDLNKFTGGVSHEYWDMLNNNQYKPLINRCVNGLYPPGSLFKLITIISAIESGIDPNMKIRCSGKFSSVGNNYFRCWNWHGHGDVDMHTALQRSCNTYMYTIAKMIGTEKILNIARCCGFGEKTMIDTVSESCGFVPSKEWKFKRFNSYWNIADSLNVSIGQGALLVTPIQLVKFCAMIASNGKSLTPRIFGNSENVKSVTSISRRTFEIIQNSMYDAVNAFGGTAYSESPKNSMIWDMSGKTGTAQVRAKTGDIDLNNAVPFFSRNHALFIGYTPSINPRYAISVVIEHGGGGGRVAAPIAKKIQHELYTRYSHIKS